MLLWTWSFPSPHHPFHYLIIYKLQQLSIKSVHFHVTMDLAFPITSPPSPISFLYTCSNNIYSYTGGDSSKSALFVCCLFVCLFVLFVCLNYLGIPPKISWQFCKDRTWFSWDIVNLKKCLFVCLFVCLFLCFFGYMLLCMFISFVCFLFICLLVAFVALICSYFLSLPCVCFFAWLVAAFVCLFNSFFIYVCRSLPMSLDVLVLPGKTLVLNTPCLQYNVSPILANF